MAIARLRRHAAGLARVVRAATDARGAEIRALIGPTTIWIATAVVPPTPISVVIASRNRLHRLPHALASVLNQDHPNLEVVVVNDGSTDGTDKWLAMNPDPRLRVLDTPGVGLAAARNAGLAAATGEFVTYLDDDNTMLPGWPRAISWAFDRFPDASVGYGARIVEDYAHIAGTAEVPDVLASQYPSIHFHPYDRNELLAGNFIDANVIAHRRDHPEARFDERTGYASDWDLALRLTRDRDPVLIPVIACTYTTRETTRMSIDRSGAVHDLAAVKAMSRQGRVSGRPTE